MKFKLCLTLFLITLAVTCLVMIIILVPILVLPSLSDTKVDFDPVPVTCQLRGIRHLKGWQKCRVWHSCRQHCQNLQVSTCSRLYVAYHKGHVRNDSQASSNTNLNQEMMNSTDDIRQSHDDKVSQGSKVANETIQWTETYIPLLINPDSCGDLPEVDCDYFHTRFEIGQEFPCYHSRDHPPITVIQYSWRDGFFPLFVSLGLLASLTVIFFVCCLILCFWHCRGSPGYDKHKIDIETVRKYAFE